MRIVLRTLCLSLTVAALGGASGCLVVAAAAGTGISVVYFKGEFKARLTASPQAVTGAAAAVLRDMKMYILSEESTEIDGRIIARTATDKKITLTIKSEGGGISMLAIRVGILGDEYLSRAIYDKIRESLPSELASDAT